MEYDPDVGSSCVTHGRECRSDESNYVVSIAQKEGFDALPTLRECKRS